MDRKQIAHAALILALVAILAIFAAILLVPESVPPSARPVSVPELQSSTDPCAHLPSGQKMVAESIGKDWPISQWVETSDTVARVMISDVDPARFNTADGSPPPAVTPTPTPGPTPDEIDVGRDFQTMVFSVVTISATHEYTGTSATGYVAARMGGVPQGCQDYTFDVTWEPLAGSLSGNEGMMFAVTVPQFEPDDVPEWYVALMDRVNELNEAPGALFEPVIVTNWFKYDGTTAYSGLSSPLTIAQLEAEVAAATSP